MTSHAPNRLTFVFLIVAGAFVLLSGYTALKSHRLSEQRLIGEIQGISAAKAELLTALFKEQGESSTQLPLSPVISEVVNKIRFRQLGHAFLIDEKATIISHPLSEFMGKSLSEVFNGPFEMTSDLQTVTASGSKRLLAFFPLNAPDAPNWYLVADINGTEAYDSRRYAAYAGLSLFVAGLLLGLGLRRS